MKGVVKNSLSRWFFDRKPGIWIGTLFFGFWISVAVAEPTLGPQSLVKGESTTLQTDYEIGDVAITDPEVADFLIREGRHQVYLSALHEGYTTLTVWDAEGKEREAVPISVYQVGLKNILEEGQSSFGSIATIQFITQESGLLLVGEAPTPRDFQRVQAFTSKYPAVINEVTLAQPALDTITSRIEQAIGTPGIKARSILNRIVLEGTVYSQSQATRAYEIAKLYEPGVISLLEVRDSGRRPGKEKMVELSIYFMEVKKSALRTLGVQWAPGSIPANDGGANVTAGGGGVLNGMAGLGQSVIGFVMNLAPKIRFIREHGLGRVLENPTFLVKSGDPATFFSGTEIPYPSQQGTEFKKVGVEIVGEPIVAASDVDLKITANLSSPSPHIQGGIDTHHVTTTAFMPAGQSLVLAGILSNQDTKTYNRLPKELNLSTALFTLFLSKDFRSNHSEFLVFVEPRIVEEVSGAEARLRQFFAMNEQIIKDRSRKEYQEYLKAQGRLPEEVGSRKPEAGKKKRRWR